MGTQVLFASADMSHIRLLTEKAFLNGLAEASLRGTH